MVAMGTECPGHYLQSRSAEYAREIKKGTVAIGLLTFDANSYLSPLAPALPPLGAGAHAIPPSHLKSRSGLREHYRNRGAIAAGQKPPERQRFPGPGQVDFFTRYFTHALVPIFPA